MILLVIAFLSATTAVQGGTINLTLDQPAEVVLDDCMYFQDLLTSSANLSAGTYQIYVSYKCTGVKEIEIKRGSETEVLQINVHEVQDPVSELEKLDEVIFKLKKEINTLKMKNEYLSDLIDTLNSINVELYDKLKKSRSENEKLRKELADAKSASENCSNLLSQLQQDVDRMKGEIQNLQSENAALRLELSQMRNVADSTAAYLEIFRSMFFFILAFLIGSYFALMRR